MPYTADPCIPPTIAEMYQLQKTPESRVQTGPICRIFGFDDDDCLFNCDHSHFLFSVLPYTERNETSGLLISFNTVSNIKQLLWNYAPTKATLTHQPPCPMFIGIRLTSVIPYICNTFHSPLLFQCYNLRK